MLRPMFTRVLQRCAQCLRLCFNAMLLEVFILAFRHFANITESASGRCIEGLWAGRFLESGLSASSRASKNDGGVWSKGAEKPGLECGGKSVAGFYSLKSHPTPLHIPTLVIFIYFFIVAFWVIHSCLLLLFLLLRVRV